MSQIETQRLILQPSAPANSGATLFYIRRKADGAMIGWIGTQHNHDLGNEIALVGCIAQEYRNNGYATEAGKAAVWWAFEQAGQDVLAATVEPENQAARRVLEKLGFICGDTRRLAHDGAEGDSEYYRLYHTDHLPGPQWDATTVYRPEPMGAFFDARAQGYNEHMLRDGGEEDYRKLGSFIPQTADMLRILDVGCGTGIELDYIWQHAPNAHITCVDVSRGMLDLLLRNHPGNHDRITIVEASYLDWEYHAEAFDLVVSSSTMHHLWPDEKVAVYRKILHSLKPGGCYIEGDFIVDAMLAEQYRRRYANIISHLHDKPQPGEYHIDIPLTVETQTRLLAEAGFQPVEVLDEDIKHRGSGAILKARKCIMLTTTDISRRFWNQPHMGEEEAARETINMDDIIQKAHIERKILSRLDGVRTVFDGGAGSGRFSIPLARRGIKVTHFDISQPMIDKARQAAQREGVAQNIDFVLGSLEDLTHYRDGQFDMVLCVDAPVCYTYPRQEEVIGNLVRIASQRLILSVHGRLAWIAYHFNPAQKAQYIFDPDTDDSFARWTLDHAVKMVPSFVPNMEAVRYNFASGLMERPEDTAAAYERGETPWPVCYGFLPDELLSILQRFGMKNIRLSGPGALSRSIPREVLANIMADPALKREFLGFCFTYDSQPWCAGMGKDNLLACAEK